MVKRQGIDMTDSSFDITEERFRRLKAFTAHGATLRELSGTQVVGDCPFCGKERHFFVNWEKLLWDCKVCGEKGNQKTFLEKINDRNKAQLTDKLVQSLAEERKLPPEAFEWVELGYHRGSYTIAVRDHEKRLIDLRTYRVGSKAMSTAGMTTGLFGLPEMVLRRNEPVYICEGEWDTIAMQWLLQKIRKPGTAVCSPGANTFKPEWADHFKGREVRVCYDNDQAGEKGEMLVLDRLAKIAKSMQFVHWPSGFSQGFDVRDLVVKYAVNQKKPKKTFSLIRKYLKPRPRRDITADQELSLEEGKAPEVDPSVTIEDVFRAYEGLLFEPSRMGIEMCAIASLAAVFNTDPIWVFLVAPPSSGKTAIISGFRYLAQPYDEMALFISHVTTHSLISGMETKRGDPSLFAELNGGKKAFFIKDFTPVVAMRDPDKEDIYAQFRDAYDGYTMKSFGNGVKREYNDLKFSLVAGVTDCIYDESVNFQALGERFGKLNIGRGHHDTEFSRNAIAKSMTTRDDFKEMEDKCARMVYSCMKNLAKRAEEADFKLPGVSKELEQAIIGLSIYVSSMRGVVSRDKYKRDYIKSAPYTETGIRFAKMLVAIACVRAFMYGRDTATLEDLPLLKKIAHDTVNPRDEEVLRNVYRINKEGLVNPFQKNILDGSRYTAYTIRCVLDDMCMLNILQRYRAGRKHLYKVSERMLEVMKDAQLYEERVEPKKILIIKRKKKGAGNGKV